MAPKKDYSKLTFPQFDEVSDMSDHHFLSRDPPRWAGNRFHKAIRKEWWILQKNLPESIFCRVPENRSDLLRAAIIGAAGTPYHDALFFFDIALTPNYPNEPPKVHYLSHGHRVNPNLYTNGTVRLSLLNTWRGYPSERWNPKQSTLLQVLLSIQSLLLNENPFSNEPGSDFYGNILSECYNQYVYLILSELYNQDVFLLTCMTTINLIENPPKNFEPLINNHFRRRANAILAACDAYRSGRMKVGFHGCDGAAPPRLGIQRNFQINMEIVYPNLVSKFQLLGASVPQKGIFRRMIKNIRDALGLKKKNSDKKMIRRLGKSLDDDQLLGGQDQDYEERGGKNTEIILSLISTDDEI